MKLPPHVADGHRFNLTRRRDVAEEDWNECTNMWNEEQSFETMMCASCYKEYDVDFHEHMALCFVKVCVKEYGAAQESTAIVLEHLEHLWQ